MPTQVVQSFADLTGDRESAVAIGFFDGVHVGHRSLVEEMIEAGSARGLRTVVLTFANHPATVVRPTAVPRLITSREQRVRLLREMRAEILCVAPFDRALSQWTPRRFCKEVLRDLLSTRLLVVGRNFVLGRGRTGTVSVLQSLGPELGFEVLPFESVRCDGAVVSSSAIRRLIAEGRVERANLFLGRPFTATGPPVVGAGIGGEIGFPTLNLTVSEELLLPAAGIYAGRARLDDAVFDAAVYLGSRSTFGGSSPSFEVHLLDFAGSIGAEQVTVEFLFRLRDDQRFPSVQELVEQIGRDVAEARRLLSAE